MKKKMNRREFLELAAKTTAAVGLALRGGEPTRLRLRRIL